MVTKRQRQHRGDSESHYEARGALELTSRACKLSSKHLCEDNTQLNTAAGLLSLHCFICSSDEDNAFEITFKKL